MGRGRGGSGCFTVQRDVERLGESLLRYYLLLLNLLASGLESKCGLSFINLIHSGLLRTGVSIPLPCAKVAHVRRGGVASLARAGLALLANVTYLGFFATLLGLKVCRIAGQFSLPCQQLVLKTHFLILCGG
jgi:hypothetical protein